jgi:hypothetical protein
MKNDSMPEGFLASREGGTVRVHLPEIEVTRTHVLEPMLTRGMAQQVAEALWNTDVESPIDRVVLVHDTRYSDQAIEKFRERLWAVLVDGGVEVQIELESEPLVSDPAPPQAAPSPAPPPARGPAPEASSDASSQPVPPPTATKLPELDDPAPTPPRAPPAPSTDGSAPAAAPGRKPLVAPVPTKKRPGGDRRRERDAE